MSVFYALFGAARDVLLVALDLYVWVIIVGAVLSWLVAFDVVNLQNRFVRSVGDFCYRLTQPALKPIQRFIPVMGGLDLSPIVLILAIMFLKSFLMRL